jgi:hypothetical protein
MASIKCPRCGSELHHYLIDTVAGGGGLAGGGGIVCPACQRQIAHAEIERLVKGIQDPLVAMLRLGETKPSWFERRRRSKQLRRRSAQKERGLESRLAVVRDKTADAEARRAAIEDLIAGGDERAVDALAASLPLRDAMDALKYIAREASSRTPAARRALSEHKRARRGSGSS